MDAKRGLREHGVSGKLIQIAKLMKKGVRSADAETGEDAADEELGVLVGDTLNEPSGSKWNCASLEGSAAAEVVSDWRDDEIADEGSDVDGAGVERELGSVEAEAEIGLGAGGVTVGFEVDLGGRGEAEGEAEEEGGDGGSEGGDNGERGVLELRLSIGHVLAHAGDGAFG
jgi:hypothetical protein